MIKQIVIFVLCAPTLFMSCKEEIKSNFDVQGHRGCRGLYPENTIPAFLYAIELGVTTLEMDVVINKDHEVIVSHEVYYRDEYTTTKDGRRLMPSDEKKYNIYNMTFGEMMTLDVGLRKHPKFKHQRNLPAKKPRLTDVFEQLKQTDIKYNIEIKRLPEQDGVYHPDVNTYIDLVIGDIKKYNLEKKVTLQSFDLETLQILKKKVPDISLALLTDNYWKDFNHNIQDLGFLPDIYSPNYKLVSIPMINLCHDKGIKIIPWTVNKPSVIRKLISWGVDGIITDYPDQLLFILHKKGWSS